MESMTHPYLLSNSPHLRVSIVFQKVPIFYLEGTEYEKVFWAFSQLTLLVTYSEGICSLYYTTNLLKDGCLACISSSYNKNAKRGASVLLPEVCDILHICICNDPVKFCEMRQYFD